MAERALRGRTAAWSVLAAVALTLVAGVGWAMRGWADDGVARGSEARSEVALTFDDGLNGAFTEEVATILERHDARGTFFVVGSTLAAQEALAQQLIARGHLLANHSYSHRRAGSRDVLYRTLGRGARAVRDHAGACPRFHRPPFGGETPFTKAAVRRAGMRTVLWDVEVHDWDETDADRLARNVLDHARPGSIVLLHDGSEGRTPADRSVLLHALPVILDGLQARGLRAVRVDTLLGEAGYLERC